MGRYEDTNGLKKLQAQIDKCNRKSGCNRYCSLAEQNKCSLLIAHSARLSDCLEQNIPSHLW